jgi:integrase
MLDLKLKVKMSTTAKVVLYRKLTLKNGEHPIYLRITKDRVSNFMAIGINCHPDLWEEKYHVPKNKHSLSAEYKEKIWEKEQQAGKLILKLEKEGKNLSALEIIKLLKNATLINTLVYDFFDEVIEREKNSGSIKNSLVYRDTRNNLQKFNNSQLHFSEITHGFLNKFQEYLQEKGKGGNSIYIYMRTFRALINKAINEGVCSPEYYPFKKFSLAQYKKIKTKKRAITKEQVYKIRDLDTKTYPHLIDARNVFLFSYYCRGINFIDICLLKYSNIEENILNYTREKTDGYFNIELLEPAKEIIEYYRPMTFSNKDSYIFPLFFDTHVTKLSIHNRHTKMLTIINKDLKEIAILCGIESLTTYVARHTYATVMKKSGQSIAVISESMGHSSESVTKIYLDSFANSFLDEANKAIL